jgi:hypothetical protein
LEVRTATQKYTDLHSFDANLDPDPHQNGNSDPDWHQNDVIHNTVTVVQGNKKSRQEET